MNINSIFDLFNSQESLDDDNSLLTDFSSHPLFWIGGFNKIINNHKFFIQYTSKMLKDISPELNLEEIEKSGEELMYNKACDYIKNVNLNNLFHVECLKNKTTKELHLNLTTAIYFYEKLEEYERCALLKNIESKVKEFLI